MLNSLKIFLFHGLGEVNGLLTPELDFLVGEQQVLVVSLEGVVLLSDLSDN